MPAKCASALTEWQIDRGWQWGFFSRCLSAVSPLHLLPASLIARSDGLPRRLAAMARSIAYSDVIRSSFRKYPISVPKVSDQDSGAIRSAFRSFDQPFRAFDQSRPSG